MSTIECKCGKIYNIDDKPTQIKCHCGKIISNSNQEKIIKEEKKFNFYKRLMEHK